MERWCWPCPNAPYLTVPGSPDGPATRPAAAAPAPAPAAGRRGAGAAFVLLAASLWAMIGPLSRLALREGTTPMEIAFWRSVIAAAAFAAHVAVSRGARRRSASAHAHRQPARVATRDLPGIAAFGLVAIAALYAFIPLAVAAGGATLAAVLLYTAPAWVALFAWLWLGERMTGTKVLALALTLAGIGGIAFAGGAELRPSPAALGWGLAAGLSYASLYLFGKRYFARYAAPVVFLHALPVAALALAPLTRFGDPTAIAWVALIVLGLASTYAPYLAYSAGLARLDASRAATIATAEPVVAALLSFVFWNERLPFAGYAAAVLVLAGVALMATGSDSA